MQSSKVIVAGVDGSPASTAAARWALAEAARRGVGLTLVGAWGSGRSSPHSAFVGVDAEGGLDVIRGDLGTVAELLREARLGSGRSVDIDCKAIAGVPGPVLVEEGARAELLVVGSHGRGAVSRSLLGSVSSYCVHHATCPTVVVPDPGPRDRQ